MFLCNQKIKKMKKILSVLLPFFAFFLFTGCSKSVVFDEKVVFPDANWSFDNQKVSFKVPWTGSDKPYAVVVELELLGEPNVDKFHATFRILTPKGGETYKSLLFNFIAPQEPYIQGDSPNSKIYRLTIFPKKYFSEAGEYLFEVNQYSNKYDNYGIRALRMYIQRVKE